MVCTWKPAGHTMTYRQRASSLIQNHSGRGIIIAPQAKDRKTTDKPKSHTHKKRIEASYDQNATANSNDKSENGRPLYIK